MWKVNRSSRPRGRHPRLQQDTRPDPLDRLFEKHNYFAQSIDIMTHTPRWRRTANRKAREAYEERVKARKLMKAVAAMPHPVKDEPKSNTNAYASSNALILLHTI